MTLSPAAPCGPQRCQQILHGEAQGSFRHRNSALSPSPGHKSLFSQSQAAILLFSPQSSRLFHADSEFFGRSSLLLRVGNLHIRRPNCTNTSRARQAAPDGSRQHNPLIPEGSVLPPTSCGLCCLAPNTAPTQKTQTQQSSAKR